MTTQSTPYALPRNWLMLAYVLVSILLFTACKTVSNKEVPVVKKEINFIEGDWHAALDKAKEERKLVFIDISASWCGPCRLLKQHTFTNAAVADFFNSNFVNVAIDGEKGIGPELAEQYNVKGYPTLVVADPTGHAVLYTVGFLPAEDLMAFAKEAIKRKPAL